MFNLYKKLNPFSSNTCISIKILLTPCIISNFVLRTWCLI